MDREGRQSTIELIARGQGQRNAACALQPVLAHGLGLGQGWRIASSARKQRLQVLGVVRRQKSLHGRAGLVIDLRQPAL